MTTPIMSFADEKEMAQCGREWQRRLYLDHWAIVYQLCSTDDMGGGHGESVSKPVIKAAVVRVARGEDADPTEIIKFCAEKTLVHELMHIVFGDYTRKDTIEGRYMEDHEHAKIEMMARSLVMAKYGLEPGFFLNDGR